jgi:hypothetical protein
MQLATAKDENTKLFHARANGHRRKVHIQSLISTTGAAITNKYKDEVLLEHFKGHLGTKAPHLYSLNWEGLNYTPHDLSELDTCFSAHEIRDTAFSLPLVSAHTFFKSYWEIIKMDIISAIIHMCN